MCSLGTLYQYILWLVMDIMYLFKLTNLMGKSDIYVYMYLFIVGTYLLIIILKICIYVRVVKNGC